VTLTTQFPEKYLAVVIVEDNRYVRQAWELVLEAEEDFIVLGSYPSCEAAFAREEIARADLVLMDIGLPGMSGIEGVRYLKEHYPHQTVVMCTVHDDDEKIFDALCAGAVGYLLKNTPPEKLVDALREASRGGSPMTPSVARKVIASFQQKPVTTPTGEEIKLTERERQILERMAQGKTYNAIARELSLSMDGVTYHIRHIYQKLQVHTRAQAVARGLQKRLIRPPR